MAHLQVGYREFVVDTQIARFGGIVQGIPGLLAGLVAGGTNQPKFTHLDH